MAESKGKSRKRHAGRSGRSGDRGKTASREARRRDQKAREDRDRTKLLARYADREPDAQVLCMYGTHAECAFTDGTIRLCLLTPKVHKLFGLCVGDRVWTDRGATEDERLINARQARRTEIRRKRGEEDRTGHVIASNVDRMAITVALQSPPLRTGALDRYLVLASVLGVEPIIVVTKIDHAGRDAPEWSALGPYRDLGIPIIATSAESGEGLDELRAALRGAVTVFAGHSGVGKSSLCLAMGLTDAPPAGDMSYARGRVRGRHTTSIARLLELPDDGGWVVDTPGVRAIGLVDLKPQDAAVHFPEFAEFASECEYASSCAHMTDEGCAVRAAYEEGTVSSARYKSYLRLMQSLIEEG
jgi:ribosome biogenesis GTPase